VAEVRGGGWWLAAGGLSTVLCAVGGVCLVQLPHVHSSATAAPTHAHHTRVSQQATRQARTCSWLLMSMTLGSAGKLGWLWYQPTTCMLYSSLMTSVTCVLVFVCKRQGCW
jgi:hypothetical protein